MKLTPVLTEKATNEAKRGNYTFSVDRMWNKNQIRREIERVFSVHVKRIRTVAVSGEVKKDNKGYRKAKLPGKKAIVTLADKEKIDLFKTKKS